MKHRLRFLVGLATLIALSLAGVEAVWASVCVPNAEADVAEVVAEAPDAGGHSDADCEKAMGGSHPPDPEQPDRPDAPHCPFGPMTTSGVCTPAPPLPAEAAAPNVGLPQGTLRLGSPDPTRDHLMVFAFFRPPRA